ncbi:MAG: hypothetical protein H8Z69_05550 [Nanohaloarchaea archaeon]|nr:hypothetical protein [Candidatus Nanohaloarchaea archaeon]
MGSRTCQETIEVRSQVEHRGCQNRDHEEATEVGVDPGVPRWRSEAQKDKCGEKGSRYRGRFRCSGTEMDADYNGAWNISKRALGKAEISPLADVGATVT